MKSFFFIPLLLLFSFDLTAQDCLPGFTFLSNQEEIDNFLIDNPDCTHILGNLHVYASENTLNLDGLINIVSIAGDFQLDFGSDLSDLSGLQNLVEVGGSFSIHGANNPNPASLGLENLVSVGGNFVIYDLVKFDFSGLESLTTIQGSFIIENGSYASFHGLNNLVSIGGDFKVSAASNLTDMSGLDKLEVVTEEISLSNNYVQEGLNGLKSLHTVASVDIRWMPLLNNIDGLNNLKNIVNPIPNSQDIAFVGNPILNSIKGLNGLNVENIERVVITDNSELSTCGVDFICSHLANGGDLHVQNNFTPSCSFIEEVLFDCQNFIKINHNSFIDNNQNGIQDNDESNYAFGNIKISPDNIISYANGISTSFSFLSLGEYTVEYDLQSTPYFDLTTNNASQVVLLDAANPITTINYGLTPNQNFTFLNTHLVPSSSRCLEWSTLQLILENPGTTTCSGILWFQNDLNTLDIAFNDPPDYNPFDGLYGWDFSDLEPGQHFIQSIEVQLPGPPDFPVGDFLNFAFEAEFNDVNGAHTTNESFYRMLIECSYDPNDKLVTPTYPDGYALIGEELVYTVRFQNTGNAVAYDVVIRDTLDAYLDPSTFRVISTSHPDQLQTTMTDDQFLSFDFPNIFLPDSTADLEGSQGYALYAIRAEGEIPEAQVVENTAGIYFDMNPPVITNTTSNIMVTTFDADADGFEIWLDCDEDDPNINPGAEEIANNDIDEDCDGMDLITGINNPAEIPFDIFPNPTSDAIQITADNLGEFDLRLLDCFGKRILDTTFSGNKNIQLAELPAGVYFLTIGDGVSEWSERVVKL